MIRYAIRMKKNGKLLGVFSESNDGHEFCVSVTYRLQLDEDDPIWMVDSREKAERVISKPEKWFNAGYETPVHNFKSEDLEVVKLNITIGE